MVKIQNDTCKKFPFDKMINQMLSLVSNDDLTGLGGLIIRDSVPRNIKSKKNLQSCYYVDEKTKKGYVELFLDNILHVSIPLYAFRFYQEIGGLLFSEFVFHEIGHHVHHTKRHGIKKQNYEIFANKYAKAGYFKYFKSRSSKILASYKWASINIFMFSKNERLKFIDARQELINTILNSKKKIKFP